MAGVKLIIAIAAAVLILIAVFGKPITGFSVLSLVGSNSETGNLGIASNEPEKGTGEEFSVVIGGKTYTESELSDMNADELKKLEENLTPEEKEQILASQGIASSETTGSGISPSSSDAAPTAAFEPLKPAYRPEGYMKEQVDTWPSGEVSITYSNAENSSIVLSEIQESAPSWAELTGESITMNGHRALITEKNGSYTIFFFLENSNLSISISGNAIAKEELIKIAESFS